MILNNTQANIFKVNGGIADNFANRPAANSSFYIFYSIDTQEIFYDNGAWVLLGSGGGGGVNIYNTDGTLTGNRTLSGANNDLTFADLNVLKTSVGGNDIGLKLDFALNSYILGDVNDVSILVDINPRQVNLGDWNGINNGTSWYLDDITQYIKTSNQGNDIGLKLDFANNFFSIGQYFGNGNGCLISISDNNNNILAGISNYYILNFIPDYLIFGDANQIFNGTRFIIKEQSNIINTQYQGNDIGLFLDFANDIYNFGNSNKTSFSIINNGDSFIGDPNYFFSGVTLRILNNTLTPKIFTEYQNAEIGLKLDFANSVYQLGQITGGASNNQLIIDDQNYWFYTSLNGQNRGLFFQVSPGARTYNIGELSGNNRTQITIDDIASTTIFYHASVEQGLKLDFANNTYQFGQLSGNNFTKFIISDAGREIYTSINGSINGLLISQSNDNYKFGVMNGGNTTNISISDGGTYPIRFNGTNLLSGTAGAHGGQHLKININGTNYKIALLNP